MTWLNPWAWFGLAVLAVPVAIHLLTRAQPKPQPFPTLRFLTQATSTAMRRRTINDRALLAVRLGILAAVVTALAQPTMRAGANAGAPIVRAVVSDASVDVEVARDRVAQLTPAASQSVSIRADHLAPAIARASTWLAERGGRGELVVISPFRRGDLDQADLASVDGHVGVRLIKVEGPAAAGTTPPPQRVGTQLWTPRLTLDSDRTAITWTASPATAAPLPFLRVLAADGDRDRVAAALAAASVVGVPAAAVHPLAIVLPDAPDHAEALERAGPVDEAWMFDVVDALRRDPVLAAATQRIANAAAATPPAAATPIARDANGSPVVEAASGVSGTGHELRLFVGTNDPLLLSALAAAGARSQIDRAALQRLEPVTLTADELHRWERPLPATGAPAKAPDSGSWQGRWFWIAAIALLGLETWMRRSAKHAAPLEVTHARVA